MIWLLSIAVAADRAVLEEVVQACAAAGRPDCDTIAAWFNPIPVPSQEADWQLACAAGAGDACGWLAERYAAVAPERVELWTTLADRACRGGHERSCERLLEVHGWAPLGWLSERLARASAWCMSGDGDSCLDVAIALDAGPRTLDLREVSGAERGRWYGAMCDQGVAQACHEAGLLLADDDRGAALDRLDMGCRLGVAESCKAFRKVARGRR